MSTDQPIENQPESLPNDNDSKDQDFSDTTHKKTTSKKFSQPKTRRNTYSTPKNRATNHKVDYNHHADHKTHYFHCPADTRINERVRKQRIEFSNDLHDIVVCMPSALDALKFEVLIGSKIDPVDGTTDDRINQIEKESMTIKQQDRVEELMSDERDLSISRTLT